MLADWATQPLPSVPTLVRYAQAMPSLIWPQPQRYSARADGEGRYVVEAPDGSAIGRFDHAHEALQAAIGTASADERVKEVHVSAGWWQAVKLASGVTLRGSGPESRVQLILEA